MGISARQDSVDQVWVGFGQLKALPERYGSQNSVQMFIRHNESRLLLIHNYDPFDWV